MSNHPKHEINFTFLRKTSPVYPQVAVRCQEETFHITHVLSIKGKKGGIHCRWREDVRTDGHLYSRLQRMSTLPVFIVDLQRSGGGGLLTVADDRLTHPKCDSTWWYPLVGHRERERERAWNGLDRIRTNDCRLEWKGNASEWKRGAHLNTIVGLIWTRVRGEDGKRLSAGVL